MQNRRATANDYDPANMFRYGMEILMLHKSSISTIRPLRSLIHTIFDTTVAETHPIHCLRHNQREIQKKEKSFQMFWGQAVTFLALAALASSQIQYTIDAKIDNSFFHELISPSISNSNTKQNIYSQYGVTLKIVAHV